MYLIPRLPRGKTSPLRERLGGEADTRYSPSMGAGKRTLAVDIGGTHIKAMVLDVRGRPAGAQRRVPTPRPATPRAVLGALADLAAGMPSCDRASVGFPGVVERGVARTAANLHPSWVGVRLVPRIAAALGVPTRVANDADIQGLGIVAGVGVELVVTLGTGIGSALFLDGRLVPNLELGHHPFERGCTYEQVLSDRALARIGVRRWKSRLMRAVETLRRTFNPHRLYLGGGNARLLGRALPPGVLVADNVAGLLGGIRLWVPAPARDAGKSSLTRAVLRRRARSPRSGTASARALSRRRA